MNHFLRQLFLSSFVAIAIGGCRSDSGSSETAATTDSPQVTSTAPAAPEKKSAPTPDLANPKVATAQVAAFAPPFPDRVELFEPPKRAQNAVKRDDEHGESVELKGFITVDQPRVVLSIDGVISPIPEGGEKYGVHVISIQPPSVVLQRGRNRWTATLE
ncbi:MAG TPA: hypothetical protein VHU84_02975 [Lacipirellulaceae bacterium]|jgi:hypothetical protein|nr:hypothetical protein [Lacipirellulaceae bacterium]